VPQVPPEIPDLPPVIGPFDPQNSRVNNSGRDSRWYSGSGIYGHTWLTVTGPVRIPLWGLAVTTPDMSTAWVTVAVVNLGATPKNPSVRDPRGARRGRQVGTGHTGHDARSACRTGEAVVAGAPEPVHGTRGSPGARAGRRHDAAITLGGGSTFTPTDPSWGYVGDVHANANGKGYGQMHDANPAKAMTHNETFPATIHQDVTFAAANVWATGTWVWAAWDYLGEAGIGKSMIPPVGIAAQIGDQSIPLAVRGDRTQPGRADGRAADAEQVAVWWGYVDELASWDVEPDHPMVVHVYTPGDHVSVLLNGSEVATGAPERAMATLTVPYRSGQLTAVASRDGREIGRTALRTVGAPTALRLVPSAHLARHSRSCARPSTRAA
jgi:hypothetical protein